MSADVRCRARCAAKAFASPRPVAGRADAGGLADSYTSAASFASASATLSGTPAMTLRAIAFSLAVVVTIVAAQALGPKAAALPLQAVEPARRL